MNHKGQALMDTGIVWVIIIFDAFILFGSALLAISVKKQELGFGSNSPSFITITGIAVIDAIIFIPQLIILGFIIAKFIRGIPS